MQIQVSDGKEKSSLFDPAQFISYGYDDILEYLESEGLEIITDSDGDYLENSEYDYLVITEIQDLFDDYDNEKFLDKPVFDFLDWGWELDIFEDDDILVKARAIADEEGVDYIASYMDSTYLYRDMSRYEIGKELFDELGENCPEELRNYINFEDWLEDNFTVVEIDGYVVIIME